MSGEPILSQRAAAASLGSLETLSKLLVKPEPDSDGTLEGISGAAGVGSCIPASSSGTTYTCTVASATYANNLTIAFKPDTTNTGAATVNISSQGAKAILTQGGQTLSAGMLQAALTYLIVYDGTQFRLQGTSWPVPHVDGSLTDDFTAYPPTRRVTAGVFAEIGGANTFTGANSFAGALSTKPVKVGSLLPATCTEGHMFWLTTAPAGQNLYGCTATNTWTLLGAGAKSVVFQAGIGSNSTGNPGGVINGLLFDFLNTDSGTSKPVGLATFPNTGGDAIVSWVYPTTWDTTALTVKLHLVIETNAAGNLTFTPFATCPADGTAFTGLSYTNGTPVTVSAGGVALGTLTVTLTLPTTGCSAGSPVFAGVNRTSGGTDTYEDKAYLTHMEFRGTW